MMNKAWIFLISAAIFETGWTYALKFLSFSTLKTAWATQENLGQASLPFIAYVVFRFGLDAIFFESLGAKRWARWLASTLRLGRRLEAPRGARLRMALEHLGPIFVKLGQVISTRRDLLPLDIADELAKLQDRVPPFDSDIAVAAIEKSLGKPIAELFVSFERKPVASASIAQVHFGVMRTREGGEREVAIKVLRPGMLAAIDQDLR